MSKLWLQFLCLNETFRMIGYSILSNNVNFVEIGLAWLWRKTTFFVRSNANISYKLHFFFGEKILVTLDTYAEKINPPSIVFGVGGGGVHGKVCWLIA